MLDRVARALTEETFDVVLYAVTVLEVLRYSRYPLRIPPPIQTWASDVTLTRIKIALHYDQVAPPWLPTFI